MSDAIRQFTTARRCDECGEHVGQQCAFLGHTTRRAVFLDVSDPEALSGLVAHTIDANYGRPTFAIAAAVMAELTAGAPSPALPAKSKEME